MRPPGVDGRREPGGSACRRRRGVVEPPQPGPGYPTDRGPPFSLQAHDLIRGIVERGQNGLQPGELMSWTNRFPAVSSICQCAHAGLSPSLAGRGDQLAHSVTIWFANCTRWKWSTAIWACGQRRSESGRVRRRRVDHHRPCPARQPGARAGRSRTSQTTPERPGTNPEQPTRLARSSVGTTSSIGSVRQPTDPLQTWAGLHPGNDRFRRRQPTGCSHHQRLSAPCPRTPLLAAHLGHRWSVRRRATDRATLPATSTSTRWTAPTRLGERAPRTQRLSTYQPPLAPPQNAAGPGHVLLARPLTRGETAVRALVIRASVATICPRHRHPRRHTGDEELPNRIADEVRDMERLNLKFEDPDLDPVERRHREGEPPPGRK